MLLQDRYLNLCMGNSIMKPLDHCPGLSNNLSGAHPLQRQPRDVDFLLTVSRTAKKTMEIPSVTRKRYHDIDTIGFDTSWLLGHWIP